MISFVLMIYMEELKMVIPKIIHQTYRDHNLPNEITIVVENLKKLNPDWEYRFYTDEDIIEYIKRNFNEEILRTYQSINPVYGAAKADFFRYLVLYREGGVYIDIKSTCIYPLSEVIKPDDRFVVTQWQNGIGQKNEGAGLFSYLTEELEIKNGEYQQWFLIAERNSPVMKYVLDTVINNIKGYRAWKYNFYSYGKRGVLFVTGPIAYTKAIHNIQDKYLIRFERYDIDVGFLYNALEGKCHTKILGNHYAKYKGYIVNQGVILNFLSLVYIFIMRLSRNFLKFIGRWKE